MLEIVVLYFLCKQMGINLRAKGWKKPVWMQIAVVLVWFVCMLIGMIGYGIYRAIKEDDPAAPEHLGLMIYPPGFLSAAIGMGLLFGIVSLLPNRNPRPIPSQTA